LTVSAPPVGALESFANVSVADDARLPAWSAAVRTSVGVLVLPALQPKVLESYGPLEGVEGEADHLLAGQLDRAQVLGSGHEIAAAAGESGELASVLGTDAAVTLAADVGHGAEGHRADVAAEVQEAVETVGVKKTNMPFLPSFTLAVVAGGNTVLYANTSANAEAIATANVEIHLIGVSNLADTDITHHG